MQLIVMFLCKSKGNDLIRSICLSKQTFRKIRYKQNMWRVYKHTGNNNDYVVYKEAQMRQQMKLESLSEGWTTG